MKKIIILNLIIFFCLYNGNNVFARLLCSGEGDNRVCVDRSIKFDDDTSGGTSNVEFSSTKISSADDINAEYENAASSENTSMGGFESSSTKISGADDINAEYENAANSDGNGGINALGVGTAAVGLFGEGVGSLGGGGGNIQNDMLPNSNTVGVNDEGTYALNQVLIYVKNFLFDILGIVAVGVFLYFGFKLITAKGNEEEFKKALMGFLYAVIGLAIVPLAWGAVKIIGTLKF